MCSPPGPEYSSTDFHDCIFFGFLPKVMICSDYSDSEQSMYVVDSIWIGM